MNIFMKQLYRERKLGSTPAGSRRENGSKNGKKNENTIIETCEKMERTYSTVLEEISKKG